MKFFTPSQLDLFLRTPGAMSIFEALALRNMMGIVPDEGCLVEAGSHKGKSAIAIASGFGIDSERILQMIDPLFADDELRTAVKNTLRMILPGSQVILHSEPSPDALESCAEYADNKEGESRFAFVFLDSGDHEYSLVRAEADFLRDKMVPGGILALHDFGNYSGPVHVWEELQREGFENVPIPWDEIKACVRENAPDAEKNNDSWHKREDPEPCFLAAVRKV